MKKSKMNLSLMLIVSAIAGTTFFFSCSKNEKEITSLSPGNTNSPLSVALYTPCPSVSNPDNPYDNIGVAHNDGLEYALAHRNEWPCNPAAMQQKAFSLAADFSCINGWAPPAANCPTATANTIANAFNAYQAIGINGIINDMGSQELQTYTHRLMDKISSYNDSTQIDSLLTSIKQIESEVNASLLNASEKQTFLGSASVARYSACYWFQERQNPTSTWWGHCPNNPIPAAKYNWRKLLAIVCADVIGYIVANVPGGVGFSTCVGLA